MYGNYIHSVNTPLHHSGGRGIGFHIQSKSFSDGLGLGLGTLKRVIVSN